MNSFEMDMRRAFLSKGFVSGVILQTIILFAAGTSSELFRMSVPILCTLPYATAWLTDYKNGFLRVYLARTDKGNYIGGKILSCAISGGSVTALSGQIYVLFGPEKQMEDIQVLLFFVSGMFWAVFSATLAAWSKNYYIAYGGGFVIYYLLVILHERYFEELYCLNPIEWLIPEHIWVFGETGIVLLVGGITLIFVWGYAFILWRCMECF